MKNINAVKLFNKTSLWRIKIKMIEVDTVCKTARTYERTVSNKDFMFFCTYAQKS